MAKKEKGGGKKKYGRNAKKPCHVSYTSSKRWVKNTRRQLDRHLIMNPNDKVAVARHASVFAEAYKSATK